MKNLGVGFLVVGIVLIVFGIGASESVASDLSRLLRGQPTDRAIWLLVVGLFLATVGLFLNLRRSDK